MYYVSVNKDNSIAVHGTVPQKIVRKSDGAEIHIMGVRRVDNECILYGAAGGTPFNLVVGGAEFDVCDMDPMQIPGCEIIFPDFEKEVIGKLTPEARAEIVSWRQIQKSEIPTDRTYRGAWVDSGTALNHDMEKVRDIQLDMLRVERANLLEQKDREWMRATGQGNEAEAAAIESDRQKLRDMPEIIAADLEAAKTIDEVKEITLETVLEK